MQVALIHALKASRQPIEQAFSEVWPKACLSHRLDETLLPELQLKGELDASITRRLRSHVEDAVAGGADAVQLTCSAFNPCVEEWRDTLPVPVLRSDEGLLHEALSMGRLLGLVATVQETLPAIEDGIRRQAAARSLSVDSRRMFVPGAMEALLSGDAAAHDARVLATVQGMISHCDVLLLTQYSLAHLRDRLGTLIHVPVLDAPRATVRHLKIVHG